MKIALPFLILFLGFLQGFVIKDRGNEPTGHFGNGLNNEKALNSREKRSPQITLGDQTGVGKVFNGSAGGGGVAVVIKTQGPVLGVNATAKQEGFKIELKKEKNFLSTRSTTQKGMQ